MPMFDFDEIRLLLEAMKMNQGTLRQTMTLNAAGLALYFSFIGKAPFLVSTRAISIFIVLSWISSLCAAIVAHSNYGNLFLNLFTLSVKMRREKDYLDKVEEEIDQALDKKAFIEQSKPKWKKVKESGDMTIQAFESAFFPLQDRTIRLTALSLYLFLLGFVLLGVAYFIWIIKA